jgi:hypothetical protein
LPRLGIYGPEATGKGKNPTKLVLYAYTEVYIGMMEIMRFVIPGCQFLGSGYRNRSPYCPRPADLEILMIIRCTREHP